MNPRSNNLDPKEERLARELRELTPLEPAGLKARIRQAAIEQGLDPEPNRDHRDIVDPSVRPLVNLQAGRWPQVLRENWFGAVAACVAVVFGVLLIQERLERTPSGGGGSMVEQDSNWSGSGGRVPEQYVRWDYNNVPQIEPESVLQADELMVGQKNFGVVQGEDGMPVWMIQLELMRRATAEDPESGDVRERLVPERRVFYVPVRHD